MHSIKVTFRYVRCVKEMLLQDVHGDVQLFSVYVPTNHIYVGDVFLLGKQDIIKVNLSVREGLGKHVMALHTIALCMIMHCNHTLQQHALYMIVYCAKTTIMCLLHINTLFLATPAALRCNNAACMEHNRNEIVLCCRNCCIGWDGAPTKPDVHTAMTHQLCDTVARAVCTLFRVYSVWSCDKH